MNRILIAAATCFFSVSMSWAQTPTAGTKPPVDCDARTGQQKAEWGRSPHAWLASVFQTERIEIEQTWCRTWATYGYDRANKAEDFGRTFFTGDGVHPAFGSIVPGSGFAGGASINLERALASQPLRLQSSIEARESLNKFWVVGGQLSVLGSGAREGNRHNNANFAVRHADLPQLTYYGIGSTSQKSDQAAYGMGDTTAEGRINFPVPKGFSFTGRLAGVSITPRGFHDSSTPSIEQEFTPGNTPALNISITDVVYGGGVDWTYPEEERLRGYRAQVTSTMQWFRGMNVSGYSFRRFDATWLQRYTPDVGTDLGTVSVYARVTESLATSGNAIPFYQQPTLGGTDIENQPTLRSYPDYRFRAPNLMLFQGEYERAIYHQLPLGFLFFYDVGKVAINRNDLDFTHMPHSFGVGITVHGGGLPLFRLYYSWGGHEGTRLYPLGNTNNFAAPGDLRGVF